MVRIFNKLEYTLYDAPQGGSSPKLPAKQRTRPIELPIKAISDAVFRFMR